MECQVIYTFLQFAVFALQALVFRLVLCFYLVYGHDRNVIGRLLVTALLKRNICCGLSLVQQFVDIG